MTQQNNEAFDLAKIAMFEILETRDGKYKSIWAGNADITSQIRMIIDLVTKNSESEIAELKSANETAQWCVRDKNLKITELQAHINVLREALNFIDEDLVHPVYYRLIKEALATTTEQSLQAHYDEVIERCAKVCDEQATEWDSDSQITHLNYAEHCAMVIRALKKIEATS